MNFDDLRRDFGTAGLKIGNLPDNPVRLLVKWIAEAVDSGISEANAMVLSTADQSARPSSRVVLLKDITADSRLVFFTNYESRKAGELEINPRAALNFFWREKERQVRIEGTVTRTSREVSEKYFSSRAPVSNASAVVSPQSRVIESLEVLREKSRNLLSENKEITLPDYWGGYQLKPLMIEFWQGGKDRLHDRIRYRLVNGVWIKDRLAP